MALKSTKLILTICASIENVHKSVQQFEKNCQKKNKFQHKWIFDPELSECEDTEIWCWTCFGKGYALRVVKNDKHGPAK